jgi:hypothetical protein
VQTGHDGFATIGDFSGRRRGLCSLIDGAIQRGAARVEGDDVMTFLNEPARHRKPHVSQSDEPDLHDRP